MTIRLFMLMVWLCAAVSCPVKAAAISSSDVQLRVDLRRQTGPLPYAYRAGAFVGYPTAGYPKDMFLSEQRPGMLQFSWQVYGVLRDAATESEFFDRLPHSNLTAWVRDTAAAGGEPYILLHPVPRWLRAGGDDAGRHRLPRDLPGWERFVQRLVDYFNNQLRIDARYIVWDEPNLFFEGTTDDYLVLYKHAAAGLLRANPKARIGGPAVSEFYAELQTVKGKRTPPLLPAFVRYCANTPLPGLAPRLPLDMLIWHTFDAAPVSPGQYEVEVKAARALLREHGYPESTELNIGSWSALDKYPGLNTNVRDSEFLGAYVVASVIAMERAGVDRHAFFNLFEDWMGYNTEFSNGEGLTTRNYVVKAGYNAYRLLGRLQGRQVSTQVVDPFVQAAAAHEGRTMRLIASNFVPPPLMLQDRAKKQLSAAGHRLAELKKAFPDRKQLEQILKDRRRIEALNVPADVRAAALELHDWLKLSAQRQREPLDLQIVVDGLPSGRYRLREYRVDGSSGNAYSQRATIDDRALQKARQAGRAAARDYLAQRWSAPEMAQLQNLINAEGGAAMERLQTLPPDRQRDARAAFALFQEARHHPVKEINAAARPRERNVSEVTVNGSVTWRTTLPPYGVLLLEAERLD